MTNLNRKALLDTIAFAEGVRTGQHPLTQHDGYDVIVTGIDGPEVFDSWADHPFANGRPSKQINGHGLTSNAAGRYQFMLKDWPHYRKLLDLDNVTRYPDGPFSPAAQDAWALQLIRERGALPMIDMGNFTGALQRISNLWASLPGAGYGQPERSLRALARVYIDAGGDTGDAA